MTQTLFPGAQILNGGSQVAVSPSQSASDTQIATMENISALAGSVVFTEFYESAEQTIVPGSVLSLPHGLSTTPKLVQAILVCKVAEQGYSVSEENDGYRDSGTSTYNFSLGRTSTNVRAICGSAGIAGSNLSGAYTTLTPANWRLIVRAWA